MTLMSKCYSELIQIDSFIERYEYLRLNGIVGARTFGADRYFNQVFYRSEEWKQVRNHIIVRDNCCDLAHPLHDLHGKVIIHHINPITIDDIRTKSKLLLDPENLIVVSHYTHEAIHYSDVNLLPKGEIERRPGDTKLW